VDGNGPYRRCRGLRPVHPRDRLRRIWPHRRNRGAYLLQRDQDGRTEFIALSLWESVDAIRAFAGDDIEAAVLYPEDERYLVDGESSVTHYEVADRAT
jgi:hypothetical protein